MGRVSLLKFCPQAVLILVLFSVTGPVRADESQTPSDDPVMRRKTKPLIHVDENTSDKDTETAFEFNKGVFLGFGQITLEGGTLAGRSAGGFGVRGAWLAQEKYMLGFDFLSLSGSKKEVSFAGTASPTNVQPRYTQAGLTVGMISETQALIHGVYTLTIASGNASWDGVPQSAVDSGYTKNRQFTILDPQAEVELNATKYVRLSLGAGYRWAAASKDSDSNLKSSDVSQPHFFFAIKMGNFRY